MNLKGIKKLNNNRQNEQTSNKLHEMKINKILCSNII